MNKTGWCPALALALLAGWSVAKASDEVVRVLLRFGPDGHRVERTFYIAARGVPAASVESESRLGSGLATVNWLDSRGSVVQTELVTDPRITHAPQPGAVRAGAHADYIRRDTGVYLLTGPASAVEIRLGLPAVELSGRVLPAELWVLDLPLSR